MYSNNDFGLVTICEATCNYNVPDMSYHKHWAIIHYYNTLSSAMKQSPNISPVHPSLIHCQGKMGKYV